MLCPQRYLCQYPFNKNLEDEIKYLHVHVCIIKLLGYNLINVSLPYWFPGMKMLSIFHWSSHHNCTEATG